jgi:hypothetical protein
MKREQCDGTRRSPQEPVQERLQAIFYVLPTPALRRTIFPIFDSSKLAAIKALRMQDNFDTVRRFAIVHATPGPYFGV